MENKTQPINIYTIGNSNGDQGGEDHYSSYDQASHSHIEEEESIATQLFNIAKVVRPSTTKYNHFKHKHRYYVDMLHNTCLINDAKVAHLPIQSN
jgi:hypothetical protein